MISSAVTDETGQLVTLLRHQDGGYALALGYPRDQKWDFHVVGVYESRQDAEAAIRSDTAAQAEIAAQKAAQVEAEAIEIGEAIEPAETS